MPPVAATSQVGTTYLEVNGQAFPVMACSLPDIGWETVASAGPEGRRRLGPAKLGPLTVRFTPPAMTPLAGWVEALAGNRMDLLDLAVLLTDGNGKVRERLQLVGCVLTGLRFPECSAADKDIFAVEAVFEPTALAVGASGTTVKPAAPGRAKKWLAANFTVSMPDLPTTRIGRVGAISLSRTLVSEHAGRVGTVRRPGPVALSPLALTVVGPDCSVWRDAALKQMAGGAPVGPRVVHVELRDVSLKSVLASFRFEVLGLSGFSFDPPGAAGVAGATARFELESLQFSVE